MSVAWKESKKLSWTVDPLLAVWFNVASDMLTGAGHIDSAWRNTLTGAGHIDSAWRNTLTGAGHIDSVPVSIITSSASKPGAGADAVGCDMLFIHPMWFHESQRIGKQKCTPTGYALHVIAELIGFLGLLVLLVAPVVLAWRGIAGSFRAADLWLLAVPFGIGVISEVLFQFSWWLARRKGFHFDYERSESSWVEAGERRTYKYPAEPLYGHDCQERAP